MPIKFGTEGWRAVIAEEFTADNVRIVTQAIAEHMLEQAGDKPVSLVVGHDTRFLSDHFARAAAEVLAGNKIRVLLTDKAVPTCAVSRYVIEHKLPAGIMITASHNPAIYNGVKIKESFGGSATAETVASVEKRIGQRAPARMPLDEAMAAGLVGSTALLPLFLKGIRDFIDLRAIRRSKYRVMVDSMHGAGDRIIEDLLKGGSCKVTTLHANADPLFGGRPPEPIPSNLTELSAAVKHTHADLGIANDGDADRLGIIGPKGMWLNPGQVMCVMIIHLMKTRKMTGTVVKTVSNTMMINRLTEALGLPLLEVPVGFKHIAKLMLEGKVMIGGEESGGIGLKGYMPERDGIVNGLLVLEAMAVRRQKLSAIMEELEKQFGQWFYGRRDLHLKMPQVEALFNRLKTKTPDSLVGVPLAKASMLDGVKLIGRDDSWLLFRRSGTEPIVRIYAESPQKNRLPKLLDFGVSLIEK